MKDELHLIFVSIISNEDYCVFNDATYQSMGMSVWVWYSPRGAAPAFLYCWKCLHVPWATWENSKFRKISSDSTVMSSKYMLHFSTQWTVWVELFIYNNILIISRIFPNTTYHGTKQCEFGRNLHFPNTMDHSCKVTACVEFIIERHGFKVMQNKNPSLTCTVHSNTLTKSWM